MHKHSTVEVLGCSGSIGIPRQGTTSFLIDRDILIDAGTGLCELTFDRLEPIEHVFLTHCHLDHICGLPLLIDTVGVERPRPLQVYGLPHTIEALKTHIFNWAIWPDFTQIPNPENPVMQYHTITPGQVYTLQGREFTFVEVSHTVPALGVMMQTSTGGWVFSGDTHQTDDLYVQANKMEKLDFFFIEAAFPDREQWLADLAKHLCPKLMFDEIKRLRDDCEVWVSHLKPREQDLITQELTAKGASRHVGILQAGQKFKI